MRFATTRSETRLAISRGRLALARAESWPPCASARCEAPRNAPVNRRLVSDRMPRRVDPRLCRLTRSITPSSEDIDAYAIRVEVISIARFLDSALNQETAIP